LTPVLTAYIAKQRKRKAGKGKSVIGTDKGKIIVVADDFTGANDTGVQFSKRNLKSVVITNKDNIRKSLKDCDVLVIDTESRSDGKEDAYKKTYDIGKIIKSENINCIYKKLDSTFRGNIGAEISGLMDSLEIKYSILVPAFPSNQRITKNGMVYVKDKLLAETEVTDDPKTPVKESFIPKILSQQTDKSTGIINFDDVKAGRECLKQKVQQYFNDNIQVIIIDALDDTDLDLIASVVTPMKDRSLFVGSAGFAEYLPKHLITGKEKLSNVVIAGSVSEVTRKQIDYACKRLTIRLVEVEIGWLFTGEAHKEKARIMDIIRESAHIGEDIIIRSAPSRELVALSFEQGKEYGFTRFDVCETISLFLGDIARDIIQSIRIGGILLTGGDTAIKTAQLLNSSGTIIHDEIQPGIPYGYFIEKQYRDIIIVSKAGGFGNEEAIFQVLNFLAKGKNR